MITQLIHPEEKKIIDKILPPEGTDLDNVGLRFDPRANEIVASDGLIILTLTMPQMEGRPALYQFIVDDNNGEENYGPGTPNNPIRIEPMFARMMNIAALEVRRDEQGTPNGLHITDDKQNKITVYNFQIGGGSPHFTKQSVQKNLFGETPVANMIATKSKILFDQIIIALGSEQYQVDKDLTSATGTTKNGYQYHIMTRTSIIQ